MNVVADGKTEEEVMTKIKSALTSQLADAKLVTIEIDSDIDSEPTKEETNPWLKHFGIFSDDPTFDDFLEEVAAYRRQVDKETTV